MTTPFVHLEIVGPRVSLDRWLRVLQDHGGCHLADAMTGMEGEADVGRPLTTSDEWDGRALRAQAARALRAVEGILPPSAAEEDPRDRPSWSVGKRGEDRTELEALVAEGVKLGERLSDALERAHAADRVLWDREAVRLALRARERLEAGADAPIRAWTVPTDTGRPERIARRLRKAGFQATVEEGRRETVILAVGDPATEDARIAVAHLERTVSAVSLGDASEGGGAVPSVPVADERLTDARARSDEARAHQRREVDERGPRARHLLDALEDAEAREAAHLRLAATDHVVAARVFVRAEDEPDLRRRLGVALGDEVVVRELAGEAADPPSLPRAVAGLPFGALAGLRPARFGEVATPSLLALALPFVVGAAAADLGVGLVFLVVGGLLGIGARVGSPRRDTALLAQLAGLVALLLGVIDGRAFGLAGEVWFPQAWGLVAGGDSVLRGMGGPWQGVALRIGAMALLAALWGLVCVGIEWRRGQSTRALEAAVGASGFLVVAGAGALAAPHSAWGWLWLLVPLGAAATVVLAGFRAGLGRLLLDLVGVFRLTAVGVLALLLFDWAFASLVDPDVSHLILAPAALLVGALAVAADAAHMAMGIPYDLALGAGALGEPFAPFARRVVPRHRRSPVP